MAEEIKEELNEEAEQETAEAKEAPQKTKEEELEEKIKEQTDKYMRLYAEYDNYQKRTQKEKEARYADAVIDVAAEILPIGDNLERALQTEVETEEDYGKWIYYEGELTTGSDICTAGIMISGGFLTASIDDITVRKMKKLVVSFDSLGGTPVESLETYENQYVVAPIDPEKEGYYFGGWYTEKDMKNLFDFNNTPIVKDITLYAKWIEIKYKDVITYETEEITKPIPTPDPELDNQLNMSLAANDKVVAEPSSPSPMPWIISGVAGLVVIVCGILAFILIKRRKRR